MWLPVETMCQRLLVMLRSEPALYAAAIFGGSRRCWLRWNDEPMYFAPTWNEKSGDVCMRLRHVLRDSPVIAAHVEAVTCIGPDDSPSLEPRGFVQFDSVSAVATTLAREILK